MHGGLNIDGTMPRGRDLGVAGDAVRGGISADPNQGDAGWRRGHLVSGFVMLHVWQAQAGWLVVSDLMMAGFCQETCKSSTRGQRAGLLPNLAILGNPRRSTDHCMHGLLWRRNSYVVKLHMVIVAALADSIQGSLHSVMQMTCYWVLYQVVLCPS
ncbi:hypothetical protein J3459_003975 [Metarhizium acridum]|uniref:uncharacterized protein n=1 Tax=Metarhizium acridum TaxID=92637 RepID=UPI001C6AA23F|nr:hypothetical protein J3458_002859 [Metarhizium acridum]KAG8428408.1 hypothetical protein J3459_003975 [Metarhizium acridum]